MINATVLRSIALQAGLSKDQIYDIYNNAVQEAKSLGKENDISFVLEIIKSFSGLDEEDVNITIKKLNARFLESGYTDFDKFIEDVWTSTAPIGGVSTGIKSTDFPSAVRPEHNLGHAIKFPSEEDDEKDEKKKENILDLDILE